MYDDNLIVEEASSILELENKMKALLKEYHQLNHYDINFDLKYDITGLFEEKKFLNASIIAERTGIIKFQFAINKQELIPHFVLLI